MFVSFAEMRFGRAYAIVFLVPVVSPAGKHSLWPITLVSRAWDCRLAGRVGEADCVLILAHVYKNLKSQALCCLPRRAPDGRVVR